MHGRARTCGATTSQPSYFACDSSEVRETLNKSAFYGKPVQPGDAETSKVNGLVSLALLPKGVGLFNQCFLSAMPSTYAPVEPASDRQIEQIPGDAIDEGCLI